MIKHSGHLRTLEFSNARRVLSQCNTRLRLLYLLTILYHMLIIFVGHSDLGPFDTFDISSATN